MKRHVSGALMAGAFVLIASGCTEDPLASLRGSGPKRLLLSASTLTVNVKDSVAVTATVVDDQGNPLTDAAAATSSAPTIVSVSTSNGAPLPVSKFFVKGVLFGQAYVKLTAGSATDSIKVFSYPASVTISGAPPDSLASGSSATLTANPKDAVGGAVTGVTPIAWSSDETPTVSVTTPGATTTALGKTPGVAIVSATLPGGATTQVPIRVYAGPFNGSLSVSSGNPGDVITATAAGGGPTYDADMAASLGGVDLFSAGTTTATTFKFAVPPMPSTGSFPLVFTNIGANQFAQRSTFTLNSTSLDDQYEAVNNDPTTAPVIGTSGDYFVILHGDCDAGGGGVAASPTDDCDDFFTITNATAAAVSVRVQLDWHEAGDVDILWCNAACSAFVGNFAGATGANPEASTVSIPAATTWRLYLNLYDGGGDAFNFVRVRVTGLP